MDDPGWVSAHLFHHGDLDRLVTAVVAPLVDELAGAGRIRGHFFLRYWEGGPHVRVRLRPAEPAATAPVRAAVRDRATKYFAAHPATALLTAAGYRELAARLGRGERRSGYETRLRPPDTVAFVDYRREHAAYGERPCLEAVEAHFTKSSALALELLRAGAPPGRRAAAGLAALVSTLAVCDPDLPAVAGRVAAALAAGPAGAAPAEAGYRRRRERLRREVDRLWRFTTTTGEGGGGQLADWVRSVRALRTRLRALRAAGRCDPPDPFSPLSFLAAALPDRHDPVGLILLRCAHLFHNRLGLAAPEEAQVAYAAARAISELAVPAGVR